MPQHLVFFIFLNNLEVVPLQMVGFAPTPANPYFSAFMAFVILAIILAALRIHYKDQRGKDDHYDQ